MNRTSTIKLVTKHIVLNTRKKQYNNNNYTSLVLLYTISIQYYFIIFLDSIGLGNRYKNISTGAI